MKSHWKKWLVAAGIAVLPLATKAPAQAAYTITDLGVGLYAADMNNARQIVGMVTSPGHAFLYTDGATNPMTDLGNFGNSYAAAGSINNKGQIVISGSSTGMYNSYLYDSQMQTTKTIVQFTGSASGSAQSINDAGQVAGSGRFPMYSNSHVFIYDGAINDIGTWGTQYINGAVFINNSGQVAGTGMAMEREGGKARCSLSDLNGMNIVKIAPDGEANYVYGLNDLGHVALAFGATGPSRHAGFYDGTLHDLNSLFSGATSSIARGLNNKSQVVGAYTDAGGVSHPFLYQNGQIIDIWGQIANGSGWTLTSANMINDNGDIVGTGTLNGESHTLLLTNSAPVPIPPAFYMFGSGLIGLIGARRRFYRK